MESSKQIPRSPAMKTLLQINTSMFSAGGLSSRLAQQFVDEWRQGNPGARVIVRDIRAETIPHLTQERYPSCPPHHARRTSDQQSSAGFDPGAGLQLLRACRLVLGR